MIKNEQT